ncbi:DNA-binding LacI/PurR family transcriptional regulator [Thermocatellispora tengchongensis]|uniref:DNA-binding LacI/PurR family transcriptional regulator n=1 Tax=Thermocatellispora tengchongensis TaxID=1073253 RepID=A0A840PDY3_9ACTN|nr:LacI family DNA-binding transcriptional regulator [Thermocatellispora tengchongensis]MBB5136946.1 DNA-binding LacI/PurR family transcriptional regulator [Thermocatellispora tengchongensis]
MAKARRVTSIDVAKEAGVSQTTVSYVLNNVPHQKISEETRQRIFAAVEKLGYTPSAAARTLRLGRSDIVLLLMPDLPLGSTAIELIEYLTAGLERHGLSVVTRIESGRTVATLWKDLAPAAVVSFAPVAKQHRADMRAAGTYVVNVWGDSDGEPNVMTRGQVRVGRMQIEHLVAQGHVRVGYAAPADARMRAFLDPRLEGVRQGCADHGLASPSVREVALDTEAAAAAARAWREEGVTAVCAFNDEVAIALLAGLRAAGLAAPADLAVIGVDDTPMARFAEPPLTTINQHMEAVAAELADTVLTGLERPDARRPAPPESATLVIRRSA